MVHIKKNDAPPYIVFDTDRGLDTVYSRLGYATPGATLTNTSTCGSFVCEFSMKVSSTSSKSPDYWMMFCSEGYYNVSDGNGVYYYEQICGAYKYFNSSILLTEIISNTRFDSFTMEANFTENAVPFILMSQDYGYVYSRITTTTSYTLTDGNYKLTGSNLNGDKLRDIITQSRDFTKDGYYHS